MVIDDHDGMRAALDSARADVARLREAVEAREKMLVAYRLGRTPSEKVFGAMERTSDVLAATSSDGWLSQKLSEAIRVRDDEYRRAFGLEFADGSPMLQDSMNPALARATLETMREARDHALSEARAAALEEEHVVYAVRYSNYEPAEIESLWTTADEALAEKDRLNANGGAWEVVSMTVRALVAPPAAGTAK